MRRTPVVIGISGGSGAGKTTLARRIREALGEAEVALLDHGRYYRDQPPPRTGDRPRFNYDHPDSLDTALLVQHVRALREGRVVQAPLYNCSLGARKAETTPMQPASTIIVEGILVFVDDTLRSLMDLKVFVDADADTRFIRRLQRDMAERGCSVAAVIDQYEADVRPMHLQFVEPGRRHADVIVSDGGHNQAGLDQVLARIRDLLK